MPRNRATDDAQDLFSRGHKALDAGDFQEAVECFSRAIRLRPDVSANYRFRAYAYLEMGDRIRALNDLDQAIRLKPDDAQNFADRAAELFIQRQFDQAIADCDRALKLDPTRVAMIALRARCHADRGDSESALKDFATAIAGDAENATKYRLWRAQLHLDLDDYFSATEDADEVIKADPKSAEAYYLRGSVLQQNSDFGNAIEDYTVALSLQADHPFARLGRAICRFLQRDHAGAISDCDEFLKLMPGVVKGYEIRGSSRKALGDLDGALTDFTEAIKLAPSAVMPFNYRAGVHYANKNYALAVRDHMEALKRDPRNSATFNQLAWVWSTCPDPDVRNGERARECATRACELTEWSEPSFLDTLAAACAECGEFDDAIQWQQKAIDMVPDADRKADYQTRLDLYHEGQPARVVGSINA